MRIIDITRTVQQAPVYPGAAPTSIERTFDMAQGAPFNSSLIHTNSHAGTHADAFCHFLKDSTTTIDLMDLNKYYGPCRVITVAAGQPVSQDALAGKIENTPRIVLHGGGESYLTKEAAEYIVQCGVQTVVTDAWSVAPLDNEAEIHNILLGAGVAVVENVILEGVADGGYTLVAFPVKYGGCDGAPVRAVLLQD